MYIYIIYIYIYIYTQNLPNAVTRILSTIRNLSGSAFFVLKGASRGGSFLIIETHIGMASFPNVADGQAHSIKLLSKHLGPSHGASGRQQ